MFFQNKDLTTIDDARRRAGVGAQHAGDRNGAFTALGLGKTTGSRAADPTALSAFRHTAAVLGLDARDIIVAHGRRLQETLAL